MVTTQDEFEALEIPRDINDCACNFKRKIVVSRDGNVSQPTMIKNLLTRRSSLSTDEEKNIQNNKLSIQQSELRPKGQSTNNNAESKAIDDLDILIGTDNHHRQNDFNQVRHLQVLLR